MTRKKSVYCIVKNAEIIESECKCKPTDLRCQICPISDSEFILSCDTKDADEAFFKMVIQPFLTDKNAINTICNLPDKKKLKNDISKLKENEITDELFLDLIKKDYTYLFTSLAKAKLEKWHSQKIDADSLKSEKAKDNLRRLGEVQALLGRKKPGIPPVIVAHHRNMMYNWLKINKIEKKHPQEKQKILERKYGKDVVNTLISKEIDFKIPNTLSEIADAITGAIFELTPEVVRKYRKKCNKVDLDEGKSTFILKPSIK